MSKKSTSAKAVTKRETVMRGFMACDAVSRDQTGKSSIHGLFDIIYLDSLPGAFKPFCLFLRLMGTEGMRSIRVDGVGPDGKKLGEAEEFKASVNGKSGAEITLQTPGILLNAYGTLSFVAYVDGKRVGWPCEIRVEKRKGKK